MDLQGKKICFLGDSITEGVGTSAPDKTFWNILGRETGATVLGYGISGTRIARQHHPEEPPARHDRHFETRVEGMEPDVDIVVVFGGTNDFGHGDAPMGEMGDRDDSTFYGACHSLALSLMEKYPHATIVFLTALYRSDEGNVPAGKQPLEDYRRAIREVAGYYGLPVLPLELVTGMQPAVSMLQERYMPDGLHPNDAGHEVMAQRLRGFLESL